MLIWSKPRIHWVVNNKVKKKGLDWIEFPSLENLYKKPQNYCENRFDNF